MAERPGSTVLTILFSPHATSVDNEAGLASGHADVALSALGRRQAAELGHHYASMKVDAVACSDLRRAHDTALIAFAGRPLPIRPDRRLREFDYGDRTRCPRTELDLAAHLTRQFPNGESVAMAVERVGAFLRAAIVEHAGQTLAVVGHVATRYGIEFWSGQATLEEIVATPWDWRDVPIWRYALGPEIDRSGEVIGRARRPDPA
jgi:broad specificity phosphatase PhoE